MIWTKVSGFLAKVLLIIGFIAAYTFRVKKGAVKAKESEEHEAFVEQSRNLKEVHDTIDANPDVKQRLYAKYTKTK